MKRILTLAAATLAGLAATIAIAGPAHADGQPFDPKIGMGGQYICQPDGTWKVTWSVFSSDTTVDGKVTAVTLLPTGTTVTNIVVGATVPHDAALFGTQIVPSSETSARLDVAVTWPNLETTITKEADLIVGFEGTCKPLYTVTQDCTGITFTFKAPPAPQVASLGETRVALLAADAESTVTLHPSNGTPDVTFKLPLTPGGPDKVVTFPGTPGLTVDLTIDPPGFMKTYPWTQDPCPPSPSPSLAQTGSSLSGPIGLGAGLVVTGIALVVGALFLFRRRRTVAGG